MVLLDPTADPPWITFSSGDIEFMFDEFAEVLATVIELLALPECPAALEELVTCETCVDLSSILFW
jgi:hypothetical protein